MQEAAPSVLTAWSNFYVIAGSSAAALTGLMFVVITLVAGDRARTSSDGISTFSTPTVVHFGIALLISAVLSAPWRSLAHAAVILGLIGLYGVAYVCLVVYRIRTRLRTTYEPQIEDWISYAVVPFVAYATIAVAAVRLSAAPVGAMFALAGGTILLIFLGIHNAWDVVTFIAIEKAPQPQDASAAADAPAKQPEPAVETPPPPAPSGTTAG